MKTVSHGLKRCVIVKDKYFFTYFYRDIIWYMSYVPLFVFANNNDCENRSRVNFCMYK
jgi:hypothetical protein